MQKEDRAGGSFFWHTGFAGVGPVLPYLGVARKMLGN